MKKIAVLGLILLTCVGLVAQPAGKVLKLSDPNELRTLVQWAASDSNCFQVMDCIGEGLFRPDKTGKLTPALAKSVAISKDKLTYTFKLRDGIVWSDGSPITAKDFAFAWLKQMSADPTNGYQFIMTDYIVGGNDYFGGKAGADKVGVKAIDDKTLEVKLIQPTPYFLDLTAIPLFFPLKESYVASKGLKFGSTKDDLLYSGPFVLTAYDNASGVTMEKNPKYWDAANVKLDGIVIRIIKDRGAALNAYKANELSRVTLGTSDIPSNKGSPEFSTDNEPRTNYLVFNVKDPDLSNLNIRKALSMAVDRKTLVDVILNDGSAAAEGLVATGIAGNGGDGKTFRARNGNLCVFDPAKAKAFWKQGVKELGHEPKLTMLTADDSAEKSMGTFVQSEFRKNLGIEVAIQSLTKKARNDTYEIGRYQLGICAWGADYNDGMTFLDLWTLGTAFRSNYVSNEYNRLILGAKKETNDAKRLQMMLDGEKLLLTKDFAISPLTYRGFAYLTKPGVKNIISHVFSAPVELKYASVD